MKIWGTRFSLIGDIVMSLPILEHLKDIYGTYYCYFSIAQKCKQSLPIFINQPLINEIKISDLPEELGDLDNAIISKCDIVLNVKPQHPNEQDWYNYRSCVEETALMAGFDPYKFTGKVPKLLQYWPDDHKINTSSKNIVIWPFAGYGQGIARSPSLEWWKKCLEILINDFGYKIIHAGVDSEPDIINHQNYKRITQMSFFDQIKESLKADLAIGTDSGSMWVIGAYSKIPQINLITNWLPNHHTNLLSLAPTGDKTINLFAQDGCDNISINDLINKINENICI
jgi:ADP-heptose:LPS heptosyltransferase